MALTSVQKEILLALVDLYHRGKGLAIKGEDIAGATNKNPGTIRNQMQALRIFGLVEGVPGPKGGYRPTTKTYQELGTEITEKATPIPVFRNKVKLENMMVTEVDLTTIPHPEECQAVIKVLGNVKQVDVGDIIRIGPTHVNKLIIEGKVIGRDDIGNIVLIEILKMRSIPKERVMDIIKKDVVKLNSKASIKEAAKILSEKRIRGAPVLDGNKVVGVVSLTDIARALAEGNEDGTVEKIMTKNVISIEQDVLIFNAIKLMQEKDVGRLIVLDKNGNLKGLVTRTDILGRIAALD